MDIVLFDPQDRNRFYPFSATRAVAHLRAGIFTMQERWVLLSGGAVYNSTIPVLQPLYQPIPAREAIWVDATVLPNPELIELCHEMPVGTAYYFNDQLVAAKGHFADSRALYELPAQVLTIPVQRMSQASDLVSWNDQLLRSDFALVTHGRSSAPIAASNRCMGADQIFLEAGVQMEHCIINASTGPVYIGKQATIMEGTAIRGPFAMGEGSVLKLNSRIYGATTFGPYCMGGGEIKNSIIMGFSNKAHDGYMGDSVIGEWCNWGAGTSNSNLKNSGGTVSLWNEASQNFQPVGNKFGLLMGDHSRTAIQTAINTGTVIGACCNVFGNGLLPKHIPNFSWGTLGEIYRLETAFLHMANWKAMKQQSFTEEERAVYTALHQQATHTG